MTVDELKTWEFLKNFQISDPNSAFSFADRLAKENGWTKAFALSAIEEYKKFVFLAKHAGHPVTPSIEVDEVWHLHLIYTQSYWKEMCKGIDFDLHHGPTKGGRSENLKFNDWYTNTIESYTHFFGHPDIRFWPSKEKRFAPITVKKIDTKQFFVVKKPSFRIAALFSIFPVLTISSIFSALAPLMLILIGVITFFIIMAIISTISKRRKEEREYRDSISSHRSSCPCPPSYRLGSNNVYEPSSSVSKESSKKEKNKDDRVADNSTTDTPIMMWPDSYNGVNDEPSHQGHNSHIQSIPDGLGSPSHSPSDSEPSSGCGSDSSSGCGSSGSSCGSSCGGGCGGGGD